MGALLSHPLSRTSCPLSFFSSFVWFIGNVDSGVLFHTHYVLFWFVISDIGVCVLTTLRVVSIRLEIDNLIGLETYFLTTLLPTKSSLKVIHMFCCHQVVDFKIEDVQYISVLRFVPPNSCAHVTLADLPFVRPPTTAMHPQSKYRRTSRNCSNKHLES